MPDKVGLSPVEQDAAQPVVDESDNEEIEDEAALDGLSDSSDSSDASIDSIGSPPKKKARVKKLSKKVTKEKKSKRPQISYRMSSLLRKIAAEGVTKALSDLELTTGTKIIPYTGSKPVVSNTKKAYAKHINGRKTEFILLYFLINIQNLNTGMRYFCSVTGDFKSILMLKHSPPAEFCPSIKAETLALFFKFKRLAPSTPLLHPDGSPVIDVFGNPMMCQGGWNLPSNVNQCLSALTALHKSRGQDGPYSDVCASCVQEEENGNLLGCRFHRNRSQIWTRGDPSKSEIIVNALNESNRAGAAYRSKGNTGLTPFELRAIRNALVNSGKLWDYLLWVIIIISSKLFLRNDDMKKIQVRAFIYKK